MKATHKHMHMCTYEYTIYFRDEILPYVTDQIVHLQQSRSTYNFKNVMDER